MGHVFSCGDGSYMDWHQRQVVRVLSFLWLAVSFVAAVVTMSSLLAWHVHF